MSLTSSNIPAAMSSGASTTYFWPIAIFKQVKLIIISLVTNNNVCNNDKQIFSNNEININILSQKSNDDLTSSLIIPMQRPSY